MFIPDELLDAAAETVDTKSVWTALPPGGKRWNWTLDSHRAFGQINFRHWCERVCSRGFPVRFFWRRKGGSGELLLDVTMWDEDADGFEENDYSNQEIPSFADVRGHFDDDHHDHHQQRTTPLERALMMVVNKPEILKEGVAIVAEFWRVYRTPDDIALKAAADQIAARAAQAVEDKLADLMRDEGYEVGEDGEVRGPEERQDEEPEDEELLEDEELDDEELEEELLEEELLEEELHDEELLEEELQDEELEEETKLKLVVEADHDEEEISHGVHSLGA